ncbi:MAG: FMN-dependent NADH-azoreductase [Candidatus Zipacnadales bacterium]
MSKLLHIKATPRKEDSRSMVLARAFLEAYRQFHPHDTIETLDVFESEIPEFDALAATGKYRAMRGERHTEEEAARWQKVVATIEHFKSFDKYVITTPMWNFSIPYRLKLYIDTIVQPSLTFGYDPKRGYFGLLGEKAVVILATRGGAYTEALGTASYDFQVPYLRAVLGLIGLTDIRVVVAEPMDMEGPEKGAQVLASAVEQAREVAAKF